MSETNSLFNYVETIELEDDDQLNSIIQDAKDWCHCYGLAIRTPQHKGSSDICQIAPFALFPSPLPRELFDYALDIQPVMSKLYFRVAYDTEFLLESLKPVIKFDQFTRKMFEIMEKVRDEGICPDESLLIQRSDYMCHQENGQFSLKQIEVNNIAASMGALSERVSVLHKRMLKKFGKNVENCPPNQPVNTVASGIHAAWNHYGNEKAVILIIVENESQNAMDQRSIEYRIEEQYGSSLVCIRLTLTECYSKLSLSESKELLIDNGKYIAAVVYFRAGYEPSSYPSDFEWQARLVIERSKAIKCPWIGLQLANTKKIQQKLAENGVLERYLQDDAEYATKIRKTFAGLWGLDTPNIKNSPIFQEALANPHKFVLKPQLEGGARNYYGDEIAEKLQEFNEDELAAHILMEKVSPILIKNYLIRAFSTPKLCDCVGELGLFGAYLGDGKSLKCISSYSGGHVLRTKYEDVNEGGVAIGAAVIDSPFLV